MDPDCLLAGGMINNAAVGREAPLHLTGRFDLMTSKICFAIEISAGNPDFRQFFGVKAVTTLRYVGPVPPFLHIYSVLLVKSSQVVGRGYATAWRSWFLTTI